MTLAVTVVCQDGVVVAADSRTTLADDRTLRVASDFTHKVFESGRVAVTTYGEALLLGRSVASHMAEFAVIEAGNCDHPGPTAQALADFFGERYDHQLELHEVMPLLVACRYRIPFDSMNLQDGIDFAVLCIRTTIDVQRLTLGTVAMAPEFSWPGVGGPIEIATVTAAAGYRWVQRTLVQGERPAGVAEGQP